MLALLPALALSAALAAPAAPASGLESADGLFAQSRYAQALAAYQRLEKASDAETRERALFRAVECQGLLFRYLQAAQQAEAAPLPRDPLWRARLLLLRAEADREAATEYGWAAPPDAEQDSSDPARRTRAQWRAKALESYQALYPQRRALARRPLSAETYFVDSKGSDLKAMPTLWDFAASRWTQLLLEGGPDVAPGPKPDALSLLAPAYPRLWSPRDPPVVQAAALMEESARLDGRGRALARELWRLKRAGLPESHPDQVSVSSGADVGAAALALRLKWVDEMRQPAARAQAGAEAASALESSARYAEAVDLCKRLEKDWPAERGTALCRLLRANIEQPVIGLRARQVPPPGAGALRVSARNLDEVHLRLYQTTPEELMSLQRVPPDGWGALRGLPQDSIAAFAARKPRLQWTVPTRSTTPYAVFEGAADPPAPLSPGLWIALESSDAAFAPGKSLLDGVIVNVTDLILFQTAGPSGREADFVFDPAGPRQRTAPAFHYYAADGRTGRPVTADLQVFLRQGAPAGRADLRTGDDGTAELPALFSLDWQNSSLGGADADALARRGGSLAFAQSTLWASHSVPEPLRVMVDLDRPIYRPGQTVRAKVTVLRRLARGYEAYHGAGRPVITIRDSGSQLVSSATLALDGYGAAEFSAELPAGRLLGRWQAEVALSDFGGGFSGSQGFGVEEYKRPEFEVTLSTAAGPFRYGRPAEVNGEARYYFGGAVPNAVVAWRVVRRAWVPWFCWWWRPRGGEREVASGTAKTDAQGRFAFSFTPAPAEDDAQGQRPAEFAVTADARDAGGRTIQATQSYRAGAQAYLFAIEPPAGFLKAGKKARIPVKLMTLGEASVAGRGRFELRRISGAPEGDTSEDSGWSGGFPEAPPLESLYEKSADGPVVASGPLAFSAGAGAEAGLPGLKEGAYRLTVSADDPWGGRSEQKVVLLSVSDRPSAAALPLPAVALPEHASYLPGETARLLVGSALLDGGWLEVWTGGTLLERRRLDAGLRLARVRVGDDHKGGFTVRWFGVKDHRVRGGETTVDVPWADKRLSVSLGAPAAVKPGQKVSWPLTVKDRDGRGVDAQALVRVFDRSLEYYAKQDGWWFDSLYRGWEQPGGALSSVFTPWAIEVPRERNELAAMTQRFADKLAEPQPPRLRMSGSRVGGYGGVFQMREYEAMPVPAPTAGAGGGPPMMAKKMSLAAAAPGDSAHGAAQAPAARADFSETAYFAPRLAVRRGRAQVAFTMPERLTGWKAQVLALTKDAAGGSAEAVVATRKDLMVRVELPRFVREGDEALVTAVVHDETDRPLTGSAALSVLRDSAPAEGALGLSDADLEKPFSAPAHGQAALSWTIRAPRGSGVFQVTAVARSGALEDAERRELPLLPSRRRLVESALAALDGTASKTLRLPGYFQKDPTRVNESLTLQLDPQLALSILNSLPYLVHYPYECTEQVLDRYVPLSIVEALYRKDPRLAQAVAKIPKRATRTPAWDRSDPRRLQRLMETPWEALSQGAGGEDDLVDVLDPALVERQRAEAQQKLLSYQNEDGSYSWFPGGAGDPYMTLLVLSGWAEAQRYGVQIPVQAARRALAYVERTLPAHLRAEPGELSLTLFAAHVLTSYPASLPESKTGYALARTFVRFADAHGDALTPLGRAYAALVYRALGERAKSGNYLDRALDGARRDPLAGVYWQPEKLSWLWYNDTVETHAFLLKTLQELRPKDERIGGMVQWLLLNRVGNQWKSTRASAAAIYALLDVLRARGALDRGDAFTVSWGTQTLRAQVGPLQFLEQPLRFVRSGAAAGPQDGSARVQKTGPGLSFASLTWVYSTDGPVKASGPGLTGLSRRYFKRVKAAAGWTLEPLTSGDAVSVGDELEVHLTASARAPLEYVQLEDPKPAGVEAEHLTSGWRWDLLSRYEEPRDSLTNFFMSRLPHGEYVLTYRVRATTPGRYTVGAALLQSMYAPEVASHSDSFELVVR